MSFFNTHFQNQFFISWFLKSKSNFLNFSNVFSCIHLYRFFHWHVNWHVDFDSSAYRIPIVCIYTWRYMNIHIFSSSANSYTYRDHVCRANAQERETKHIYFFDSKTWQHEWQAVKWKQAWYVSTQKSCKLDCNVNTHIKCGIRDQSASVNRINEFWGNESSEREDLVAVMHDSWVNGYQLKIDEWVGRLLWAEFSIQKLGLRVLWRRKEQMQ